jgi:hypothetical protein
VNGCPPTSCSAGRAPGGDAVILLDEDLINLVGERAPDHRARRRSGRLGGSAMERSGLRPLRRQPQIKPVVIG